MAAPLPSPMPLLWAVQVTEARGGGGPHTACVKEDPSCETPSHRSHFLEAFLCLATPSKSIMCSQRALAETDSLSSSTLHIQVDDRSISLVASELI